MYVILTVLYGFDYAISNLRIQQKILLVIPNIFSKLWYYTFLTYFALKPKSSSNLVSVDWNRFNNLSIIFGLSRDIVEPLTFLPRNQALTTTSHECLFFSNIFSVYF